MANIKKTTDIIKKSERSKPDYAIQELTSNSPYSLLSQALAQSAPIEYLERLMDLQARWEEKEAKKAFLRAFSNFQDELPEIPKTKKVKYISKKTGQKTEYNYSPLPIIIKTIKPFLNGNGFSYRWEFEQNEKIKCTCIISHIGGHSETSTVEAGKDTSGNKNDIQSIGSTRQYLQRYTLIAVLGLTTTEEDNDGESAEGQKTEKNQEAIDQFKIIVNEFKDYRELAEKSTQLVKDSKINSVLAKKIIRDKYEALK